MASMLQLTFICFHVLQCGIEYQEGIGRSCKFKLPMPVNPFSKAFPELFYANINGTLPSVYLIANFFSSSWQYFLFVCFLTTEEERCEWSSVGKAVKTSLHYFVENF